VIGGIAQATSQLRVGTAVTCPTFRVHPAIVAQAAATCALMTPGRSFLGLGTGANLNEHIESQGCGPETEVRQARQAEAIGAIRQLSKGGVQSDAASPSPWRMRGCTRCRARAAAAGRDRRAPERAAPGELADGAIATAPERQLLEVLRKAGRRGQAHLRRDDRVREPRRAESAGAGARALADGGDGVVAVQGAAALDSRPSPSW
jgi:coenzyme F420-dependent glucose-6-phosphate dehydrogenase